MRQKIVFCQYNSIKLHRCGLLLTSLNDVMYPYTYKGVRYVAKQKTGYGPYHLKSTIDYTNY